MGVHRSNKTAHLHFCKLNKTVWKDLIWSNIAYDSNSKTCFVCWCMWNQSFSILFKKRTTVQESLAYHLSWLSKIHILCSYIFESLGPHLLSSFVPSTGICINSNVIFSWFFPSSSLQFAHQLPLHNGESHQISRLKITEATQFFTFPYSNNWKH